MRKKNRLRTQTKKASVARAQAEMAARKEKLKVLEMERKARLRIEASNGKEKEETLPRPHWDSSVSSSVGEINGPWSRSSYPVAPVDFPLPKPIEGDGLPSAGLAKSSCESFCVSLERNGNVQEMSSIADCNLLEGACMHAESPQEMINVGCSNHHVTSSNKNVYQHETKVFTRPKVCSNHRVKSRSYSPVQCFKDGTKGMRPLPLSKITKTSKKQQHTEVSVGQPSSKTFPKYAPKCTLSQQAYDTESSTPLSYRDDGAGQSTFSTNKRKLSTYSLTSQKLKFVERQLKLHAQANGLHDIANIPTAVRNSYNTVDFANESMPCHSQYLTYHLERFPSKYKMEAWTEKKRVALLKVLAQQLVIRLNAAESHPSYLLNGNVWAHALSLRKNLEKFQDELHGAAQTLDAFYSQPSRTKSSGYIVLPSKLERKRNFHFEKSLARGSHTAGLHLQEEAFNNQDPIPNQDLSSEKADSATSIMTESPILEEREKYRQQKIKIGDPFKDNILTSGEGNTQVTSEGKAPEIMFQDLELRLRSICVETKSEVTAKERRSWNHHLVDRELEKLDAEIKETKLRMARNLFSSHPLEDTSGMNSPLSLNSRCTGDATCDLRVWSASPTIVSGTEGLMDLPNLAEENSTFLYHAHNEQMGELSDEKGPRQSDSSSLEADNGLQAHQKEGRDDVISKDERGKFMSVHDYIGPGEPIAVELPRSVARRNLTESSKSPETSTLHINMEFCTADHQVPKVEISQVASKPTSTGDLKVLFKQGINADQEILADTITEALLRELLDSELSDMLLQSQDASHQSELRRMKREVLKYVKQTSTINLHGACKVQNLSDVPKSPCASVSTSPLLANEGPNVCRTGPLMTHDDFHHWNYQNYDGPATTIESISPANDIFEFYREPFKVTSKRLVEKFVEEILEAQGLLSVSHLLELYASGKTLSLVLKKQRVDERNFEEQLFGNMLLEAVCECLDKKFLRFHLPCFFLFLQPCPAEPYLKKALMNDVNEHADAACEGGFSLEHILEKSLDEEDWKKAHQEMVKVVHEISEHVMVDMIISIVHDLTVMKQTTCSLQASPGFTQMWEANCFQVID
ncbi:hypothetical protein L7F22_001648 [Adiantum nelumboides]|nr:hypothetical protein [Adiantum nelumboides]